jgi:hypothetical protein
MVRNIHKRAIELWVVSKIQNKKFNPAPFILSQLTGQSQCPGEPQNAVQLCEIINDVRGFDRFTHDDLQEIQNYCRAIFEAEKGSRMSTTDWLNWTGYLLAPVSIAIGGFSWWILGFAIATWWANGALALAAERQGAEKSLECPPAQETSVQFILHVLALGGLIGFSIYNVI